jgi:hypothetical protein
MTVAQQCPEVLLFPSHPSKCQLLHTSQQHDSYPISSTYAAPWQVPGMSYYLQGSTLERASASSSNCDDDEECKMSALRLGGVFTRCVECLCFSYC